MEKKKLSPNFWASLIFVLMAIVGWRACTAPPRVGAADRWPAWTPSSELLLGQCLRAESDTFRRDWPLISHCLVKQWRLQPYGRTIGAQIGAHCALFKRAADAQYPNPGRRRQIRGSTWDRPLHGTAAEWTELRGFVDAFTARKIKDPCPKCLYWAGHTDTIHPGWFCPIGRIGGRGNLFCYVQFPRDRLEVAGRAYSRGRPTR